MNSRQIALHVEYTLLAPEATTEDVERLCREARECGFFGVCVNGAWVRRARECLTGSGIAVVSVAGFPLGAMSTASKCSECENAVSDGADEIDVVLNIGRLLQGDDRYVLQELCEIVRAAQGRPVKVILETCLLGDDRKISACRLAVESGARFVKTSTGFSRSGATTADVALMRRTVGPDFGVKASGGIRDAGSASAMLAAGASRLGTSSGVAIWRELQG